MVAKKYGEIHKYGGKIYKKINLIKKFGFRVGSGWDLRTQTEPTFYIGFSISGSRVVRVLGFGFFLIFRFGFRLEVRVGRVLLTPNKAN